MDLSNPSHFEPPKNYLARYPIYPHDIPLNPQHAHGKTNKQNKPRLQVVSAAVAPRVAEGPVPGCVCSGQCLRTTALMRPGYTFDSLWDILGVYTQSFGPFQEGT